MDKHSIKNTQQKPKSNSKWATIMKQELQSLWQKAVPGAGGDLLSTMLLLNENYVLANFMADSEADDIWHTLLSRKHTNVYMLDFEPLRRIMPKTAVRLQLSSLHAEDL